MARAQAQKIAHDFLADKSVVDMSDEVWWCAADENVYELRIGEALMPDENSDNAPKRMSVPEFVGGVAFALCDRGDIPTADLELLPEVCYELALEQALKAVEKAFKPL
jgi:hypothetical protein